MIKSENSSDINEVYISDIISALKNNLLKILFVTAIVSAITVVSVLNLPNIYRSETTLVENSTLNNSDNLSRYSSLASLAGVGVQKGSSENNTAIALELVKSLNFFQSLINNYDILVPLLASKGWDPLTNTIIINDQIYNKEDQIWNSKNPLIKDTKPSIQVAHKIFLEAMFIDIDKNTGFIKLSIEHISPFVAKEWVGNIVDHLNNIMRKENKDRATHSIHFLTKELNNTTSNDIRTAINSLMTKEYEKLMLVNSFPDYVFRYISNPYVPEKKIKPTRSVICIVAFLLSLFLSSLYFVVRELFRISK